MYLGSVVKTNFNLNYTVAELLNIVNEHKHKYKIHVAYQTAPDLDHEVVLLPPYHCQYKQMVLVKYIRTLGKFHKFFN